LEYTLSKVIKYICRKLTNLNASG